MGYWGWALVLGPNLNRPMPADEIPEAYKSIETVMANQRDLVAVEHTLRQVINVKG
jgi:RNA-splicing ligase RtcB